MLDMAPPAQQVLNKCLSNDKLIQTGSLFGGNQFCFKKHLTSCILVICCKYFQTTVVAMGLELRRWGTAICLEQWGTYRMGFLSACFIYFFFCTIKFIMKMNAVFKQDWRQLLVVGLGKVHRGQGRLNQVVLWLIQLSAML